MSPSHSETEPVSSHVGNGDDTVEDDIADDDMTIIELDIGDARLQEQAVAWIEQTGPDMEQRRRNVLLRELRRVQRTSFLHFLILCLIPLLLVVVVLITVLGDNEDCLSDLSFCYLEPRTFMNAFTTRCVCESLLVEPSG